MGDYLLQAKSVECQGNVRKDECFSFYAKEFYKNFHAVVLGFLIYPFVDYEKDRLIYI